MRGVSIVAAVVLTVLVVATPTPGPGHPAGTDERLPKIGAAPDFALTDQDGRRLALSELRGRVVAVTFIYAACADTCPLLTAKLARVQDKLGPEFGPSVFFVSITVDPERDTPAVLKSYARGHGAKTAGWAFVTGTPEQIRTVARRYGVFAKKTDRGDVDHTFLTSLIDRDGMLRVQYMGVRFDPDEFLRDVRSLLTERRAR